ncbi:hypothetical protein UA3_00568 [Enterococcus faecium EnGen0263]|uniref:hypothetical protein n=1 Tax=Enterococcus TaxID=1350 RepID=UPI00033082F6|nr:hypothetical protein [Enterococcus faecium]EOH57057.1 hypothetical protein UA3_00568 [Enterococcus faecium EnGen0263]MCS8592459.1 hypothetical protein [Enterococcus faecium]
MTSYYSDKEHVEIAQLEYSKLSMGQELKIKDKTKTIGYVSQVINNPSGEQSFVITHTDRFVSPVAPLPKRLAVKEVTVLYRGSTGLDKIKKQTGDVWQDWVVNNVDMARKILAAEQGAPPPQLRTSAETLKEAMRQYPNAQFFVYGHSLGSMNGQYAVADLSLEESRRLSGGYFFQGPNIYTVLTPSQRVTADLLTRSGKLHNYVDEKDLVPIGYSKDKPMIGRMRPVLSKKVGWVDQHMWGGYQYDQFGNVLLDTKEEPDVIGLETQQRLAGIENVKRHFLAKGSLSSAQKIFLDASQAKAITSGYKKTVETEISELKKWFQTEIRNANELWQTTKLDARYWGASLTYYEELEALDSCGVTERSIRIDPVNEYERTVATLRKSEEELERLLRNIEQTINRQVDSDHELSHYLF